MESRSYDRYEVEAENEEAALKQIKDAHYKQGRSLKLEFEDQHVDYFTKFENDGEVEEDED
ncbi:hypothetical protein D3C83_158770 [compost metagenome]